MHSNQIQLDMQFKSALDFWLLPLFAKQADTSWNDFYVISFTQELLLSHS